MTPAMTPAEARAALGVDRTAGPDAIRAAFRTQIGRHHPDVNPGRDSATQAVRLIAAWEVLRALTEADAAASTRQSAADARGRAKPGTRRRAPTGRRRRPPPAGPAGSPSSDDAGAHLDDDSVAWALEGSVLVAAPWDETMLWLVDAAHRVGDVTFLDPSSGLVEALVEFVDGPTVTLIMSLQGRAALTPAGASGTEVWISMEPWSSPPRPELPENAAVAELMAHHLRAAAAELSPSATRDGPTPGDPASPASDG